METSYSETFDQASGIGMGEKGREEEGEKSEKKKILFTSPFRLTDAAAPLHQSSQQVKQVNFVS